MSWMANRFSQRPLVCLTGEYEHQDFSDAVELLHASAELIFDSSRDVCPDVIIAARSRLSARRRPIEGQLRSAPLAGRVELLGSWCEGEARASRLDSQALRVYWHEFAAWWERQLALSRNGICPEWGRTECVGMRQPATASYRDESPSHATSRNGVQGVIALRTSCRETFDVLASVLLRAGYASVWQPGGQRFPSVCGAAAGIWEGGQLDDGEVNDLRTFCQRLAGESAPVIALLDFPRRDRYVVARQAGAVAVLGKPWLNTDLVSLLKVIRANSCSPHAA